MSPTEHVDSIKTYALILFALLCLTALTTVVAYFDLHRFNAVAVMVFASAKMLLVALYFMHVRHSTHLTKLVLAGGLLWLAILICLSLADFGTRGWLGVPGR